MMNDNTPPKLKDVDQVLKHRASPPAVSDDLPAQIIQTALKQRDPGSQKIIWFYKPQAYLTLAACLVLTFGIFGGFFDTAMPKNTSIQSGKTNVAMLDEGDIDVLYYWEDFYL